MKEVKFSTQTKKTGVWLFAITIFLVLFGVLMVYSASYYFAKKNYNNQFHFLIKQLIGFVIGLFMLLFFYKFDYNKLQKYSKIALLGGFVLLILVFVPNIGVSNYGAHRWIGLPGFTIQSSEIAKFCFILFCSSYLAKNYKIIKTFKGILPILIAGALMCLLIILEPNMSITMCVGIVMILMLFVGGISFKHFLMLAIPALIIVPVLIFIEPYRLDRLVAFINPWASPKGEGYQLIQSFFSISDGGIFGVGLFNSRQKFLFLPFAESDFIFAVIAEEFGLFGCFVILSLYFILIFLGIKIAIKAKNRFGCYLATGIVSIIAVQTILNIAVVSGLIPPTGLPLPFISAGSTSIIVFMSAIGIMLNINCQNATSFLEIKSKKEPFKLFLIKKREKQKS